VVIDAADAEHAMIALQTMPIDCLVTDVNLPGLSGPDFAEKARALRPNVGIVYATGDDQATGREPGAILLLKPYRLEDMAGAIAKAIKNRASAASTAPGRQTEKQDE
jgi:DNA-binding response OmpR family regulator